MKKLLVIALCALCSCTQPVLDRGEYVIVDTINVARNGFGAVLGYDVVIEFDSSYHYGYINKSGELTDVNIRKYKNYKEIK
jgi:hypothetical protein